MHPDRFRVPRPSGPEGDERQARMRSSNRSAAATLRFTGQHRAVVHAAPNLAAVAARLPRRALLVSALALLVAPPPVDAPRSLRGPACGQHRILAAATRG